MSLDFIFVKAKRPALRIADLEMDEAFLANDYRMFAEQLTPSLEWQADGRGLARLGETGLEFLPADSGLHLTLLGARDVARTMEQFVYRARNLGIVTIDVQSSEIYES